MLLAVIVFVGVFLVAALIAAASGTGASQRTKQTLARLDALLMAEDANKDEQINIQKQELLSSIPLLNRILLKLEIAPRLRRLLYQANVKWTPGGLLLLSFVTWVLSAFLINLRTGAFLISMLMGLVPGAVPVIYVLRKRSKRLSQFEEGLPAVLELMVSGLRAGHSLVSVIGLVAREAPDPLGPEFRICFDEQTYGLELRSAMENLAIRMPVQDIRILMTAILIQKETGGNLAEVLDKCAYLIRERFRLKKDIRSKTAQGRLTGWILALAPLIFGAMLYLIRPEVMSLLWTRPAGVKFIYIGTIMITIGSLLIRKIVSIRV